MSRRSDRLFDSDSDLICGLKPDALDVAKRLYEKQPHPVDGMPYSDEFEYFVVPEFRRRTGLPLTRRDLARLYIRLRKHASRPLPLKGRQSRTERSPFDCTQAEILGDAYKEQPLPLDQLAYTNEFEKIEAAICYQADRIWTPRQIFVGLMALRKSGRLSRKSDRVVTGTNSLALAF